MNDIRSSVYAQKVELLLRLIPIVMEEGVFAIHGGTAINLFLKNLPRYSVDIDLSIFHWLTVRQVWKTSIYI